MGVVVASVPAKHVYVRHLSVPGDGVRRLPDPRPRADVPDAQWWPPRMLEPAWVREHADEFDVLHVHFGFDALAPDAAADVVAALRAARQAAGGHRPRPAQPAPRRAGPARRAARVLVLAADAVITLTPRRGATRSRAAGAGGPPCSPTRTWCDGADCCRGRGRPRRVRRRRPRQEPARQHGPGARRRRRSSTCWPTLPGARLRVDAHTDVMTPVSRATTPAFSRAPARPRRGRADRAPRPRLLLRRRALGLPPGPRRVGPAVPVRHALRLARGVLRPRHGRRRPGLRVLRRAAPVPDVHRGGNRVAADGVGAAGRPQRLRRPTRLARRSRRAPDRTRDAGPEHRAVYDAVLTDRAQAPS